jgi:hypothetical protein
MTATTEATRGQTANDRLPASYELYSKNGKLMGSYATQIEAERHLGAAFNAKFLVGVATNGDRICLIEREELH